MSSDSSKVCQAEENTCKRDVQAQCYHCAKSMCRIHFAQHMQLLEEITRNELNLLADQFNELSARFDKINKSPNIHEQPLIELENWRTEAHKKIDQFVENKHSEIMMKMEEYRTVLAAKNDEQIRKINDSKKLLGELIQQVDASRAQMNDLQTSINKAEAYLESLNTHRINLIRPLPICYMNVNTQFFDYKSIENDELRKFRITYIRLNGVIRTYYVKTIKTGTINDLMNSFIEKYPLLEGLRQVKSNSMFATDHQPKNDFIHPVEIHNHRVQKQYSTDGKLSDISYNDQIVFYEMLHSMKETCTTYILMPCLFRRLPEKQPFGFPIYLNVPRHECKGQDILDALHNMLGKFFQLNPNTDQNLYNANLAFTVPSGYQSTHKSLNDALEELMDFKKVNTMLTVDINDVIAKMYENDKNKNDIIQ